ncbi:protein phosphatase 1 regulatory subunit 3D-like [Salvelinus fontinalis]|uniref:protein phosphatase 1 regulatory subunit 3D-like n=1 Tax=Salvelinus fontinalis TaxID=8038 RepID=UPI00248510A8|nr:protein phosphatase 1 regulatory subunit 3D-like [Salvelinus fontinalis]
MMSSMTSVGRSRALFPGGVGKERERESSRDNDRLKTVSPCIKGQPRTVSPGMIGGPCQTTTETIRVTDILDSKPEPNKAPVRIRPRSARPPPPKEPMFVCSLSSDPPTQPIIRRRAQSLPSVHERIRDHQVRFLDSLGLELEDVKVFKKGEEPRIPAHVFSRLLMSSEMNSGRSLELSLPYFKPCFPENRGSLPGFVQDQVLCSELGIIGTVQVLNLAFNKEVTIHFSFTNWRSNGGTRACWVANLHRDQMEGPESDVFRFRLPVPPFILLPGAQLEFAVCYRVMGAEYWDNNDGNNYKLSYHSYTLTVPRECEDSMVHYT